MADERWHVHCKDKQNEKLNHSLGLGFVRSKPQMRKTGLATETAFYLQLGSVMTDKNARSHSFISPPATPSALPSLLPLHPPEEN